MSPKTASVLVDVVGEASKPVVNYGLETPLKSIYNDVEPLGNYTIDGWNDAFRDAVIQGTTSGAIDAWSDAQNWALNKTYDTAISP